MYGSCMVLHSDILFSTTVTVKVGGGGARFFVRIRSQVHRVRKLLGLLLQQYSMRSLNTIYRELEKTETEKQRQEKMKKEAVAYL